MSNQEQSIAHKAEQALSDVEYWKSVKDAAIKSLGDARRGLRAMAGEYLTLFEKAEKAVCMKDLVGSSGDVAFSRGNYYEISQITPGGMILINNNGEIHGTGEEWLFYFEPVIE